MWVKLHLISYRSAKMDWFGLADKFIARRNYISRHAAAFIDIAAE